MPVACTKSGKICKSIVAGSIACWKKSMNVSQIPVFKALARALGSGIE